MSIDVCLGIWHDHVAVGMSVDTLAEAETYLRSSTFKLSLRSDRTLVLERGDGIAHRAGENQQLGYEFAVRGIREVETARCQNHWIRMLEDEALVHPFYSFRLDPDHRMPWPRVRKCDSYWVPDEIFKEIVVRRRSCLAAKERWAMPPASITARLTPKHRLQLHDIVHMDRQRESMLCAG